MTRFQLIHDELICCTDDGTAHATGHLEGHTVVVVHAGSTAKGHRWVSPECHAVNKRYLDQGVVAPHGDGFRFKVAFPFESPHAASEFILGDRAPIGFDVWKAESGKTLRELLCEAGWGELIPRAKSTYGANIRPNRKSFVFKGERSVGWTTTRPAQQGPVGFGHA